jgi:hypothetical protein
MTNRNLKPIMQREFSVVRGSDPVAPTAFETPAWRITFSPTAVRPRRLWRAFWFRSLLDASAALEPCPTSRRRLLRL